MIIQRISDGKEFRVWGTSLVDIKHDDDVLFLIWDNEWIWVHGNKGYRPSSKAIPGYRPYEAAPSSGL